VVRRAGRKWHLRAARFRLSFFQMTARLNVNIDHVAVRRARCEGRPGRIIIRGGKSRSKTMKDNFAEVVEEVKNLSTEEKMELQALIEKYLAEERRQEIFDNYQASLDELKEGKLVFMSDVDTLKGMLND
jgi:hypothetical protein